MTGLRRIVALAGVAIGVLGVTWAALDRRASAHLGAPPLAVLNEPVGAGTIADESFTFHWFDSNRPVATGTATVNIYYTRDIPPTFSQGVIPPTLTGTAVVTGILETDRTDAFTWDTRGVPSGTYWLWSRVVDPPNEPNQIDIITFSPGVLTVRHGSDPLAPAIVITSPNSPFRWADAQFVIEYDAFDPDGTGRVKLEAATEADLSDLFTIAEDLPASEAGQVIWDTSALPEADYTLRATITDARGRSFTAYARYYVLVTHITRPDAGSGDQGATLDGRTEPGDAGVSATDAGSAGGGGGCSAGGRGEARGARLALLLLPLALFARTSPRGRRAPASPRGSERAAPGRGAVTR